MASVTINYQSERYYSPVGCSEVGLCLPAAWAAKTVSGAPIVVATLANSGRFLGSRGYERSPEFENPRREELYQYTVTYDDTQIIDPVTDVIGCADIESLVDACAADALVEVYANMTPWVEGSGEVYLSTLTDLVGIGTNAPTAALDVNSDVIRLRTAKTPATAAATGNTGDIAWDAGFIYVCIAPNTWVRAATATWV